MNGSKKPELLVPAGSLENLKVAVAFGADAVYLGGEAFGLRAKAKNFSSADMAEGIRYAHEHNVRVYITVNILAHNADLPGIRKYLEELRKLHPDGLIIADPGVFLLAKEICPEIPRHISTQANNTNSQTCRFWADLGAKRVVTARELSLEEIQEIKHTVPEGLELESFVHGAMCISYSGRCLLSNFLNGRDANKGECTHPCRWKYSLMEETRPGEYFPVEENERGTYLFNSRDLCMIEHIPELIRAGIDSFKIEGRMKTALYVATVTRAYRKAIDDFLADPEVYRQNLSWYQEEVASGTNRRFTTGFYFGRPTAQDQIYDTNTYHTDCIYLGLIHAIDESGRIVIEQKNKFSAGDRIEILRPGGETLHVQVAGIYDAEGAAMDSAPHARQELHLEVTDADGRVSGLHPFDILRKRV